jgi:hypothetical protein
MWIIYPLILIFGIFFYVGWQGWRSLKPWLSPKTQIVYWFLFAFLNLLPTLLQYFGGRISPALSAWGTKLQFWQIIALACLVIFTATVQIFSFVAIRFFGWQTLTQPLWSLIAIVVVLSASAIMMAWGYQVALNIQTTPYEIQLTGDVAEAKTYKLAVISDLHLGYVNDRAQLKRMDDAVLATQPDLVLVVGDLLHHDYEPFLEQNMAEEWARLQAPLGVYVVLGNHDAYSGKSSQMLDQLSTVGITVAQDKSFLIDKQFILVGRQDKGGMRSGNPIQRAYLSVLLKDLPTDLPTVVMDHQPTRLYETTKTGLVDLMISGHTHAGQFWPVSWVTQRIYEVNYGQIQVDDTQVIVTSGIGTWGPTFRLGSISEIALITLTVSPKP